MGAPKLRERAGLSLSWLVEAAKEFTGPPNVLQRTQPMAAARITGRGRLQRNACGAPAPLLSIACTIPSAR